MDKYEKIRVVGRGAYGIVYLCLRLSDKKLVIIKQIPVEQMTKDERQTALNEVKVLSMLDHPYIAKYFENFLEDKALMIVMEYAEGGTVFEYIQQRNGTLFEEEVIMKIFAQMLLSLQHVHNKQILHRDLKTQNILLDKKMETVKISDFGISKVLSSKSKAYTVVGTPCYISPELCESKPYNQKSDIWALGCVLYELVMLKRAFEAQTLPALVLKIMRGTITPIASHYSDDLKQLIFSMLHLDPAQRPTINDVMCQPIVLNVLMNLYADFGKIACRRVVRPVSGMSGAVKNRPATKTGHAGEPCKSSSPTSVYCWGSGLLVPTKLTLPSTDTSVTLVSAGRMQKAAVTKNGRLILWESATSADVLPPVTGFAGATYSSTPSANSTTCPANLSTSFVPRYLEGQSAVSIQHVACGDLFTTCLTDRGILLTFGSGASGCLGHGNHQDVTQAKIVETLLGYEVIEVACGASHVLAITNEHEVFAWGRAEHGRLGLGSDESHCAPQQVSISEEFTPSRVYCGVDCSIVLTVQKKLLCSGSNRYNKLALDGDKVTVDDVSVFTPVQSRPITDQLIQSVAMGTSHTAIVTDLGECYTFGSNQFHQLGHDKMVHDRCPRKVVNLDFYNITAVGCGDTFTIAISKDGGVFSWGKNSRGRLGRVDSAADFPALVPFVNSDPFEVVSLSCSHGTTLLATRPASQKSETIQ